MRAGFIPARPERKESIMAVPASKRAQAMGEYVIQARIVLSETQDRKDNATRRTDESTPSPDSWTFE